MAAHSTDVDEASDDVVRLETAPGKFVFAERDNTDGWIATDTVVDPEP